jgi:hypothetical protein
MIVESTHLKMRKSLLSLAILASAVMATIPASAQQWINSNGEMCWFDYDMSPTARCKLTFFRGENVYICCQRLPGGW